MSDKRACDDCGKPLWVGLCWSCKRTPNTIVKQLAEVASAAKMTDHDRIRIDKRDMAAAGPAHVESADCWCEPDIETYEGGDVIIHRDVH